MGRYYYDNYYTPSKPKPVKDGIKAKTKQGKSFGDTWWSKKWIALLESFGWDTRLQRGRSYARKGQVVDINIKKGIVTSSVQGSQPKPYKVRIEMKQISDKDWDKALNAMSEQAIFAAKLLAGEMPNDIEDAFNSARVSLFPSKNEIETDCSCPDWANPCKHIAAVYYLLGERFDEDPFFIFLLRGRSKDEVMEMLRQRRSTVAQPSEKEAKVEIAAVELIDGTDELANDISFWNIKEPLDKLQFKISDPEVSMGIVKRLGNPPGWNSKKSLSEMLEPYYEATKAM